MIPAWKLKREWNRLVMQVSQWHWFVFAGLRRRRHDFHKARARNAFSFDLLDLLLGFLHLGLHLLSLLHDL